MPQDGRLERQRAAVVKVRGRGAGAPQRCRAEVGDGAAVELDLAALGTQVVMAEVAVNAPERSGPETSLPLALLLHCEPPEPADQPTCFVSLSLQSESPPISP